MLSAVQLVAVAVFVLNHHATGRPIYTMGGKECYFPFEFAGNTYTSCTDTLKCLACDRPAWCSLVPQLDSYIFTWNWNSVLDDEWGYCNITTFGGTAPEGSTCEFPFVTDQTYTTFYMATGHVLLHYYEQYKCVGDYPCQKCAVPHIDEWQWGYCHGPNTTDETVQYCLQEDKTMVAETTLQSRMTSETTLQPRMTSETILQPRITSETTLNPSMTSPEDHSTEVIQTTTDSRTTELNGGNKLSIEQTLSQPLTMLGANEIATATQALTTKVVLSTEDARTAFSNIEQSTRWEITTGSPHLTRTATETTVDPFQTHIYPTTYAIGDALTASGKSDTFGPNEPPHIHHLTTEQPKENPTNRLPCDVVPTWYSIKYTIHEVTSSIIVYSCKDGSEFPDGQVTKVSRCENDWFWSPKIVECLPISAALQDVAFKKPVEAPHAEVFGVAAIIFISLEMLLLCIVDSPNYKTELERFVRNISDFFNRYRKIPAISPPSSNEGTNRN